jgi:type IV pilus assembly protein PilA
MSKYKENKGFTLIEILIVIGLIAVLATIVLIAINPARQFAQARNTQRSSNVNTILNAIGQYVADNKGSIPSEITTTVQNIKTGQADLCAKLMPTYVSSLPVDPAVSGGTSVTDCASYDTGYTVIKDSSGRIMVCAPNGVEPAIPGSTAICVTR